MQYGFPVSNYFQCALCGSSNFPWRQLLNRLIGKSAYVVSLCRNCRDKV